MLAMRLYFCLALLLAACTESSLPGDGGTDVASRDVPGFADVTFIDVPRADVPLVDVSRADTSEDAIIDVPLVDNPFDVPPPPPDALQRFYEGMLLACEAHATCGFMPGGTFCEDPVAFVEMIIRPVEGESEECFEAYVELSADVVDCVRDRPCPDIAFFAETGELPDACQPPESELRRLERICDF